MKHVSCQRCNAQLPLGDAIRFFDRTLCLNCAQAEKQQLPPDQEVPEGAIYNETDPTICRECQHDNGTEDLQRVAGVPLCGNCDQKYRSRPFPTWLKLSFAAVVMLAIIAFVRNERFYRAYVQKVEAKRAMQRGDFDAHVTLIQTAAALVPEDRDLSVAATLAQAMQFMQQDRAAEALPLLRQIQQQVPADPTIKRFVLIADAAAAFDRKDYDHFLAVEQEQMALVPNEPSAVAGVASAFACKYAVTGNPEFKQQALELLEKAKKLAPPGSPEFADYEARIRFRIDTRRIISKKEYDQLRNRPRPGDAL